MVQFNKSLCFSLFNKFVFWPMQIFNWKHKSKTERKKQKKNNKTNEQKKLFVFTCNVKISTKFTNVIATSDMFVLKNKRKENIK